MRLGWFPILLIISILLTSFMISRGYTSLTIFLTSGAVGGILGYITGKMGYEA